MNENQLVTLYYFKSEYDTYSEIKTCKAIESKGLYKIVEQEDDLYVSRVLKSTMNTYEFYFFASEEEAKKGLEKELKWEIATLLARIKNARSKLKENKEKLGRLHSK